MPIYEYETESGEHFEIFFKSFKEAEPFIDIAPSPTTGELGKRVVSIPLEPHLYGDPAGYHKPSPTKRYSTKLVSRKEGNASAIG